jgi:hypothetical protein
MDDFLNFNENMGTGNQNPATEQVGTIDKTEDNNLKELEQNVIYFI